MARIGIDARKYFDFGIGTYLQYLIGNLQSIPSHHEFLVYVSASDMGRVKQAEGWKNAAVPYKKYSAQEFLLFGRRASRDGVRLLHVPHYTLPAGLKGRAVVTIHDLIHLKFPEYFTAMQQWYARWMMRSAVMNSGAVIVPSHATKNAILERFNVDERKIEVIPHAIDLNVYRVVPPDRVEQFRRNRELHRRFVLYVGGLKPHKNIPTLLKAFARVSETAQDIDLVFVGESIHERQELQDEVHRLGIQNRIHDLGRMGNDDIVLAYNAAEMVVLPSFDEGFGFTPLESMACGTPSIVAASGSLSEVVGDAALLFDPHDHQSLADAMQRLLSDPELRNQLVHKGLAQVRKFSWEKTARQTLAAYERVLHG